LQQDNKPHKKIVILPQAQDVARYVADEIMAIGSREKLSEKGFHISLSGGSTPAVLYKLLAREPYCSEVCWSKLHFWWGDERCVLPEDPQSNYGASYDQLFGHIKIPAENLHRIVGEADPWQGAEHYAKELLAKVSSDNGIPVFDWILLGLGDDGHTASLFPESFDPDITDLIAVSRHPISGQKRITMNAKVLCASKRITFLVTGEKISLKVREILHAEPQASAYPAFNITSLKGITEWVVDKEAAKLLKD